MKELAPIAAILTIIAVVVGAIWSLFFFLWNAIAADIFGAPELTFWQAVGLLVLIGLVTSGFRAAVSKD